MGSACSSEVTARKAGPQSHAQEQSMKVRRGRRRIASMHTAKMRAI